MSETTLLTRSAFAARQNWSPSYVTKLGKEGKLVTTPDGKLVDVDATLAKIKRGADPAKEAVRARHEATRIDRDVYSARDTTPDADPSLGHDFQAARAEREYYQAQLARTEYQWVSGLLVSRIAVEDAAEKIGANLRDRIMGLPRQIAPELASMTDPWSVERHLEAALRKVLDDMIAHGANVLSESINDPDRGKLADLSRAGKERYGSMEPIDTS
ncbi:hypothetical protein [Ralstonia sp. TCR112]|uniref:hypothetical protein n=1 Tax=Ralstonia sp. TCR112 TaxID=2601730 RepID=UPI001C9AFEAE|nr:hypothetical protein [Ralstonia sp. TCR112]